MYKIMTPGPTQVAENVRLARSRECTNPDLDESFVEFYKETCEEISRLLHTDNETLILGGEGILGLRMKRVKYWDDLIVEVHDLLQKWRDSDADRSRRMRSLRR